MDDKIRVFALGGLDERGKNLYVVEINNDIFVLDCGLKFPSNAVPGVDALIPQFNYLKENKSRVKAYIISHAHDDVMGALPYIHAEVPAPIVTSPFTAFIIEKMTKNFGLKNKYQFDYVEKSGQKIVAGRKFYFVRTTHSVPFSYSFGIETSQGLIVYTSDYVIDFNSTKEEYRFAIESIQPLANNVLMLLSDSNNAHLQGHAAPDYTITNRIAEYFEHPTGRVFAALYSTNLMALSELLDLSSKYNKTVIIIQKEANDIIQAMVKTYTVQTRIANPVKFEKIENINRIRDKDTLVILMNTGSNLFKDIISFVNGGLSNMHIDFLPTDTFILDCPSSPLNEVLGTEALDETYKTGCKIVHFSKSSIRSMHACEEDIKFILAVTKPKYYIPVDGSFTNLMANAKIALNSDKRFNYSNIFVLDNGMIINAENGVCRLDYKNKIETGDILIDGTDVGNIGNNVIEERNKLSKDGIVIMGVTVSTKQKEIIGGPDVQMRGFVFLKDSENLLHTITNIFLEQVNMFLSGYSDRDQENFEEKILEKVSYHIFRETGKRPVIIPAIVDIDN